MSEHEKQHIVVIGGGSGIYPVLQGLKEYHKTHRVTAIISMADSGGSNARIRDQFGLLPLSDVKRALTALSVGTQEHEQLLRELFNYRFQQGEGIKGHHFGNLLLVALTDLLGSEAEAIKAAARILRVRGRVLPVTTDNLHIVAEYEDGVVVKGEHTIDEPTEERFGKHITKLWTEPVGQITDEVTVALASADMIVLGPGDLYTSLIANCVVGGMPAALQAAPGKFVYVLNLMTRPGQTDKLTAAGHVNQVVEHVGREPDVVVVDTGDITQSLIDKYAAAKQYPVVDDTDTLPMEVVKADLLSDEEITRDKADVLVRSLIRGDAVKTARLLVDILARS